MRVAGTSHERSTAARYWNAIHRYLGTGNSEPLDAFTGHVVAGHELLVDADLIDYYARRGELDFESFYGEAR